MIGKGAFGKVWRVKDRSTNKILAIKQISKLKLIKKKSVSNVMNEFYILRDLRSLFIVDMLYAFQDRENLYIVMPEFAGGDLRFQMTEKRVMTEKEIKFLAACIVMGLERIHNNNLIHKDLKPENILLDNKGYAYITDFGISKFWRPDNRHENAGTPPYMAPEVLAKQNHSFSVDFYSMGIILYELIAGSRPYKGKTRKELRDQVSSKQVELHSIDVKGRISDELIDFCNRLIQRKREKRLGENGIEEVKRHPWFKDINWGLLKAKALIAPFIPKSNSDNYDKVYVAKNDEIFEPEEIEKLKFKSVQAQFREFEFNYQFANITTRVRRIDIDKENFLYQ